MRGRQQPGLGEAALVEYPVDPRTRVKSALGLSGRQLFRSTHLECTGAARLMCSDQFFMPGHAVSLILQFLVD